MEALPTLDEIDNEITKSVSALRDILGVECTFSLPYSTII